MHFALTLELLFVSLEILDHKVLSSELVVVAEVVDFLVRLQVVVVENVVDLVSLHPENVPVVVFHLFVALLAQSFQHTVPKGSLELNLRGMGWVVLFFYVFSEVVRHFEL